MSINSFSQLRDRFEENFASVWKLLSDTNHFLSRTPLFSQYEEQIREWRQQLKQNQSDINNIAVIKKNIVHLRRELRERGYNLRLGKYMVAIQGFRSDDAPRFGFTRAVTLHINQRVYIMAGQSNHNDLKDYLRDRLDAAGIRFVACVHSLWYRWDNRLLIFSGADSESKEAFEEFKKDVEMNEFLYLDAFRGY